MQEYECSTQEPKPFRHLKDEESGGVAMILLGFGLAFVVVYVIETVFGRKFK